MNAGNAPPPPVVAGYSFVGVVLEFFIIAIAMGLNTGSWWYFGGALITLFVALVSPLAWLLFLLLSGYWAYIVLQLLAKQPDEWRFGLAALAFLVSLSIHSACGRWLQQQQEA